MKAASRRANHRPPPRPRAEASVGAATTAMAAAATQAIMIFRNMSFISGKQAPSPKRPTFRRAVISI